MKTIARNPLLSALSLLLVLVMSVTMLSVAVFADVDDGAGQSPDGIVETDPDETDPVDPDDPTGPDETGPVDPDGQIDPDETGPTDPDGPTDPIAPIDPTDPVDPADPVDPDEKNTEEPTKDQNPVNSSPVRSNFSMRNGGAEVATTAVTKVEIGTDYVGDGEAEIAESMRSPGSDPIMVYYHSNGKKEYGVYYARPLEGKKVELTFGQNIEGATPWTLKGNKGTETKASNSNTNSYAAIDGNTFTIESCTQEYYELSLTVGGDTVEVTIFSSAKVVINVTGATDLTKSDIEVVYSGTRTPTNSGNFKLSTANSGNDTNKEFTSQGNGSYSTMTWLDYKDEDGNRLAFYPNRNKDGDVVTITTIATAGITPKVTPSSNIEYATATNGTTGEDENGNTTKTYAFTLTDAGVYTVEVDFDPTTADPEPDPEPQPKPEPTPPSGGGSGSSSGGGSSGGGGGGGGSSVPPSVAKSANVNSDGSVNSTKVTNDIKQAINSATGDTAVVTTKNAESISASTLQSLAKTAASSGKQAVLQADTVGADGKIEARLYVEPAKLTGLTGDLKLGVSTQGARPDARKNFFEKHFDNKVSVISCAQQGTFGARLKIAAKVQLPGNGQSLKFYSYDSKNNTYRQFETAYRIDKNGYLHFETELAGDIIISDKPLQRK